MATQNAIIKHIESKIKNPAKLKEANNALDKIRSNYGIQSGAVKEETAATGKDTAAIEERA
jgi:hypothetical protein